MLLLNKILHFLLFINPNNHIKVIYLQLIMVWKILLIFIIYTSLQTIW